MTIIYCSKGHENPSSSRFCCHCGEKLDTHVTYGIQRGQILSDRYVIVRQLGQGGFGRTYLAEDVNRFRELCVLKEFSPQVQTTYVLQKAEELFEREASVLYKLQHPQIPRFRELFRSNLDGKEYLFLVQDYVEGQTFSSLLEAKKQQGLRFTETEVCQLLQQILPVLEYIHALGVIHRDISPDNLILRTSQVPPSQGGGIPVLIDFGGVKQVAATVASQYFQPGVATPSPSPTLLGKIGYAPPEQMQSGLVEPHSDLYALAATVLVLLTGKQPQELIDTYTLTWQWRREVKLSSTFGEVLDKMLSPVPSDRYQSAHQVLHALTASPVNYPLTQPPTLTPTIVTLALAHPPHSPLRQSPQLWKPEHSAGSPTPHYPLSPEGTPSSPLPTPPQNSWTLGKTLRLALVLMTAAGVGSWGVTSWIKSHSHEDSPSVTLQPTQTPSNNPTKDQPTDPLAKYSPAERQRKQRLHDRRQQLGIDYNFYIKLVNQVFRDRNPSLGGRTLSDNPEDESLRAKWDQTSGELLEKLALLSSNARQQLGHYTANQRDRWKEEVNQIHVGSRSLYDLGDAAFFEQFPEQRGKNFLNQPIGQVWQGFVYDKLNAILTGRAFQKIVFDQGAISKTISGTLNSADGKVFIAQLAKNQFMDLKLQANPKVLLSVYSPSGKIRFLEDFKQRNLSVKLPEDGFYEFVVVSTASEPVDYQLSLTAENPAPTPNPTETTIIKISTPTPTFTIQTPLSAPTPTPTPTPAPTAEVTP